MRKPFPPTEDIAAQIALEPYSAELHQLLGKALYEKGDYVLARDAFERAIVYDPADPWSHLYLGNILYRETAFTEALQKFKLAHRLAPDLAIPLICMADAYHCLGNYERAEVNYVRAVEVEPDNLTARKNLQRWRDIKGAKISRRSNAKNG